jgi:thiosulfate dehydrogenase (quinone) large subunit
MAKVNKNTAKGLYALALARISLGAIFLWAFFDKMFGLGFSTCRDATTNLVHPVCSQAWVNNGSPTSGFLNHATGPFASFYHNLAGLSIVDYLFMATLAVIGVGLLFGIGMRFVTTIAIGLLLLMWGALLWPAQNPLIDEHIVYVFVLIALNVTNSQQKLGLRNWWVKNTKNLM